METIDQTTTTEGQLFTITDEDGIAAELLISDEHSEILNIEVREDRRGEGLARHLYDHAYDTLGVIYHSLPAHCTPEGLAFAEAMGGEIADECHMTDVCTCSI